MGLSGRWQRKEPPAPGVAIPDSAVSNEQIAAILARLDEMFSGQLDNPEMKVLYDTAVKFAQEGKIRG